MISCFLFSCCRQLHNFTRHLAGAIGTKWNYSCRENNQQFTMSWRLPLHLMFCPKQIHLTQPVYTVQIFYSPKFNVVELSLSNCFTATWLIYFRNGSCNVETKLLTRVNAQLFRCQPEGKLACIIRSRDHMSACPLTCLKKIFSVTLGWNGCSSRGKSGDHVGRCPVLVFIG